VVPRLGHTVGTMTIALWVIGVALVIVGLAGVVLPALPGTWLILAGLILAAAAEGFTRVGVITLVVIGMLGLSSYAIDFLAAGLGTKRLGASPRAMAGAMIGTIAGLFLGLPGLIIGPFVGAAIGEWTVHKDLAKSGRAGAAAWIGFAVGTALKVGVAFLMIGLFIGALIF
jgi:uncharacterized protein YqgC (DUF456 family)